MTPFEQYALAHDGALQLSGEGGLSAFGLDLKMMQVLAQRVGTIEAENGRGGKLNIFGGIVLDLDVNGYAERVGGAHFCCVTFGFFATALYASEMLLLRSKVFPDIGDLPGRALDDPFSVLPPGPLLADSGLLVEELAQPPVDCPIRAAAASYVRMAMFMLMLMHEYSHCVLGHCEEVARQGSKPRLDESGGASIGRDLLHGLEFVADRNGLGLVTDIVHRGHHPSVLFGLCRLDLFTQFRLTLASAGLVASIWHALDARDGAGPFHPAAHRRFTGLAHAMGSHLRFLGYSGDYIKKLFAVVMGDLAETSRQCAQVKEAFRSILSGGRFTVAADIEPLIEPGEAGLRQSRFFTREP